MTIFVLAGSTDNNPTGSGEHARFSTEGNLPEIRIVMQNLPELRGTYQKSRMIRIVTFGHLSGMVKV